jgi:hypothetical protein
MITKKQYDAGLNPEMRVWKALSPATQLIIEYAEAKQIMNDHGTWIDINTKPAFAGAAYRIHPDTPYKEPGIVGATEIKGLKLRYDSEGRAALEFRSSTGMTAQISLESMVSVFKDTVIGGPILAQALNQWASDNRPSND